jgi:FixJ family two-component response regulator
MREREHFVAISDSCEACLHTISSLLDSNGFTVRTFNDSRACLEAISQEKAQCDLVVTGLRLHPLAGLEFIKEIKRLRPAVPVVVLTSSGCASSAVKAYKLGVSVFIEKPVKPVDLIASVHAAMAAQSEPYAPAASLLSKTEYQIMLHLLQGKSTKEIALERHRSIRTIEDHRATIMKKLGVDNAIDLVKRVTRVAMPFE